MSPVVPRDLDTKAADSGDGGLLPLYRNRVSRPYFWPAFGESGTNSKRARSRNLLRFIRDNLKAMLVFSLSYADDSILLTRQSSCLHCVEPFLELIHVMFPCTTALRPITASAVDSRSRYVRAHAEFTSRGLLFILPCENHLDRLKDGPPTISHWRLARARRHQSEWRGLMTVLIV